MKRSILSLISLAVMALSTAAFADDVYLTIGQASLLPICGGSVEITKSDGQGAEQLNIVLTGVDSSKCDTLSITGNDLNKKYTFNSSASFTLPKAFRNDGGETAKVIVEGPNGGSNDRVFVSFENVPAAPAPGGSNTGSGNGW